MDTNWHELASKLTTETRLFIDGKFVDPIDGRRFEMINPATGETSFAVARGGQVDIERAIAVARKAFRSGVWSRCAPRDRMDVLYRFEALLRDHASELALLDTLNMGKPIANMMNIDVPLSALTFKYFAECIDKLEGVVTNTNASSLHMIVREPLGVVGCITPWNFPLMMAAWKVAPALAAGNSVVLKPAEQSPLSALLMARLLSEAGLPDGVFNVVTGLGEEAGKALALSMDVDKIAFTGSTEVGKLMYVFSGQSNMKRVSTECGGKSPQVILEDYDDIGRAVEYAVDGICFNQGEVCSAGSRLLISDKIYDEFVDRYSQVVRSKVVVGDPLDEATTMGPLVTHEQQHRVEGYIDIGRAEGAKVALDSTLPASVNPAGAYVKPTLFSEVSPGMRIAKEEIFGPVGAAIRIKSVDEAITIANDSIYGLAASIWTRDLKTAHRFAKDVEAGMVWVNCYDHGDMTMPWGGYKQSGQGRDKCFETLVSHTQTKSVWIDIS